MKIKWLGHSCFKIVSSKGIRVLTDPFDDNVGYNIPSVEADIVTTSHNHFDHNFVDCVKGKFEVVNKVGNFLVKDIPITGIHTFHDSEEGAKRGDNIIYNFNIDGIHVCHLGDLGHTLSLGQIAMVGKVDVLLIPVGGVYTLDANVAKTVVEQLKPSIIIPMHYKTHPLKFELNRLEDFTSLMENVEVKSSQYVEIKPEDLKQDSTKVIILKYE